MPQRKKKKFRQQISKFTDRNNVVADLSAQAHQEAVHWEVAHKFKITRTSAGRVDG